MAGKFKIRELLSRYPWLDTVRMNFLEWVCTDGIGFFDRSYRVVKFYEPEAAKLLEDGPNRKPVIFSVFHGRMVGLLGLKPRKTKTILISPSRDGEMIARGCLGMGFSVARGSSKQGAVKGGLEMIDSLKKGQDLIFMVDGPRGPRFEVKPGIVRVAEMTQAPIIPFVCCCRTTFFMTLSWDHFMAPWWSTPSVYIFGKPIYVPDDASDEVLEEKRIELHSQMEHIRKQADGIWHSCI